MSFHKYEKKVNRKTNKIRQVIDDKKKYKMQRKETLKKIDSRNEGKEKQKPTFSMKKNDSRQFLLIFFKEKFSPIAIGERNNSLINMVT